MFKPFTKWRERKATTRAPAFAKTASIHCPSCRSKRDKVIDSRERGTYRYRMRECKSCGTRFSTMEICSDQHNVASIISDATIYPKFIDFCVKVKQMAMELPVKLD